MTNFEYFNLYKSTLELENYSPNTIKIYSNVIQNFLSTISKSVTEITVQDFREYLANYKATHNIKSSTLNNYQHYISSFFKWLAQEGYLSSNPCANLHAIKTPKIIKEGFTAQEMDIIRQNCTNKRQKAIIEILYSTGMRVSELVSLTKESINWDRRKIKILGKGNKEREVYFSKEAETLLKSYLNTREDNNKYIFVSMTRPPHQLSVASVEESLRELGKRSQIHVHPHRFRHTCATVLLERGMALQDVSTILGHSKLDTTMIYCTLDQDRIAQKYDKIMN